MNTWQSVDTDVKITFEDVNAKESRSNDDFARKMFLLSLVPDVQNLTDDPMIALFKVLLLLEKIKNSTSPITSYRTNSPLDTSNYHNLETTWTNVSHFRKFPPALSVQWVPKSLLVLSKAISAAKLKPQDYLSDASSKPHLKVARRRLRWGKIAPTQLVVECH